MLLLGIKNYLLVLFVSTHRCTSEKEKEESGFQRAEKRKEAFRQKKRLNGINVYITNIAWNIVPKEQIHSLYSLRWQI